MFERNNRNFKKIILNDKIAIITEIFIDFLNHSPKF